jgi:NAD(P)-dependent dehydrogenase (short-subunit alcohol dehydrogenase family)
MDQVIVITGATAGIGRATAIEFAKRGAKIALLARGELALEATAREVESCGGTALAIPCDVADPAAVEAAADRVERELGPIDVWVNNAVASMFSPIIEMTGEEFRRITEVTYLGQVYGTQSALKRMMPRNRGKIVLMGSGLAFKGIPLQSAYCASKFALRGFLDSLRMELRHARSRVSVTMIEPSSVNTPYYTWARSRMAKQPNAAGPVFQPEVIAKAIVWSTEHHRRELAIGWPAKLARAAEKFAPHTTEWFLGKIGFAVQQTNRVRHPQAPDNLFEPVPGPHSIYGEFGDRAHKASPTLWLGTHRKAVWATLGLAGMALLVAKNRRR